MLALDAVEDFRQQALGVGAGDSRGRGLNRNALLPHGRYVEAVGGKLLGNLLQYDALARRQIDHDGRQQALAGHHAFAARAQMLLEQARARAPRADR